MIMGALILDASRRLEHGHGYFNDSGFRWFCSVPA